MTLTENFNQHFTLSGYTDNGLPCFNLSPWDVDANFVSLNLQISFWYREWGFLHHLQRWFELASFIMAAAEIWILALDDMSFLAERAQLVMCHGLPACSCRLLRAVWRSRQICCGFLSITYPLAVSLWKWTHKFPRTVRLDAAYNGQQLFLQLLDE